MAEHKKSRGQLEAELNFLRNQRAITSWASVLNNLIRWFGLVAIAAFAYMSIDALSGKATSSNINVPFLANLRLRNLLPWVLALGAVVYGWRQRDLRKTTVERLQARIRDLERRYDPNRSTSGLTPRGDTNPEDK